MALVNVTNVVVLDNPTTFTNPLTFEVTFECLQELDADLEWKVIYVGSAEDERFDQVLEEVDVGPIPVGVNKFVLTADSPDPATIPPTDLVGVTVTLITCCYKSKEFIRVGYYVNNEHTDPAINAEIQEGRIPPADMLNPANILRNILADKPRVTRFPIDWNAAPGEAGKVATEGEEAAPGVEAADMMDEGVMEDDEDLLVGGSGAGGEAEGGEEAGGGDEMDEDMGGAGEGEAGEGSESMGSDGEGDDDRSVDLEEEEASGDNNEEDADSSGAEEMEDVAGDAARAAIKSNDVPVSSSHSPAVPTQGTSTAPGNMAEPGVLVPTSTGNENDQPGSMQVAQQQQQHNASGAQAANCGNGNGGMVGVGPVGAKTSGGTLLF